VEDFPVGVLLKNLGDLLVKLVNGFE